MKKFLIGVVVLLLAVTAATTALAAQDGPPKKVVVCKYVGTPNVDERLQTGQNPIVVSVNALKGFTGTFPFEFADAQGRSIAIRYAVSAQDGDIAECPAPAARFGTPVDPTIVQPTCDTAGEVILPEDTEDITYVYDEGTQTVTATAAAGYVLEASSGWVVSQDGATATFHVSAFVEPEGCDSPPGGGGNGDGGVPNPPPPVNLTPEQITQLPESGGG